MKIIIDIPEKTNVHIRSDYGHGVKGLRDEDREIVCDAIYNGIPYEERPHGEWIFHDTYTVCGNCGKHFPYKNYKKNFCPNCGSDNRPKEGEAE